MWVSSLSPLVLRRVYVILQRHHIEDVVVGGTIGLVSSVACFLTYWHNPFTKVSSSPRSLYREMDEATERPRRDEYQLAPVDEV